MPFDRASLPATPFGTDGPFLAAILDRLDDIHDLLQRQAQPARPDDPAGAADVSEPAPPAQPDGAVAVQEPAPKRKYTPRKKRTP